MAKKEEPKIVAENDLERKIMEAFEVFDHTGRQCVDVREIGTVLRSLGCCPTEEEVQEVIKETENKEATDSIPLANFLPYMVNALIQHKFYPANAEQLLEAFRYFDTEGRGYLTKEKFIKLMTEEGEPFMPDEVDEMMQTALDPVTDTIAYEYYINQLMVVPLDAYNLADEHEAERKRIEEELKPKKRRPSELLREAQKAQQQGPDRVI